MIAFYHTGEFRVRQEIIKSADDASPSLIKIAKAEFLPEQHLAVSVLLTLYDAKYIIVIRSYLEWWTKGKDGIFFFRALP
jgi:hypothetical protein